MQICTLEALHGMTSRSHIPQRTDTAVPYASAADRKAAERLYPDHAVGIGDEVNKVIEMLQLESEKCAVAVAVCGFGGAGKSTLGDAVYARLNLEGKTQEIKEMRSGQQALRKIMQKETVFPFVDSVLQIEHLRHLLPKKLFIKSAQNKIRLFLTVQGDQNVALALKNWRFQSCEIFKMKPLSTEAAMQLLCRKFVVDSAKRTIHERPEVKKLVQLCSGCPRVLEEVGAYLDRSKNADAAFDKVIKWLEHGLSFSAAKENGFGEPNIQDLHDDLPEDAKDVFLDICFFFNGWNWDENHQQMKGIWMVDSVIPFEIQAEQLDAMHASLRVFALGDKTTIKGKCKNAFDKLVYFQAGKVPELPFEITKLRNLTFLDNNSDDHMGFIPETFCALTVLIALADAPKTESAEFVWTANIQTHFRDCCKAEELAEIEVKRVYGIKKAPRRAIAAIARKFWVVDLSSEGYFLWLQTYARASGELRIVELSDGMGAHLLELPERLGNLISLVKVDLKRCKRLRSLPSSFGLLKSLTVSLSIIECLSLTELPEEFCHLTSVEDLSLVDCISLQRLPKSFKNLTQLRSLNLAGCKSLSKLPNGFGKLECLEKLDLSGCNKLKELCGDFDRLKSLVELNLSNCSTLNVELMEILRKLQKLASVDITESPSLIMRWEKEKDKGKEKDENEGNWHFAVKTGQVASSDTQ
eukprot:Gb_39914 [translate_table: standard]